MKDSTVDRVATRENIGAAIAVLHRLDYQRLDDDVRDDITRVRQILSVAQSRIYERICEDENRAEPSPPTARCCECKHELPLPADLDVNNWESLSGFLKASGWDIVDRGLRCGAHQEKKV